MNKIEIVNYITIPSPIMLHRDRFQFNWTALRCRKTYTGHLFLQRNDILLSRLAINGCLNAIHTSGTQQRDNTVQRISSITSENRQSIVCNCVVGSGLSLCVRRYPYLWTECSIHRIRYIVISTARRDDVERARTGRAS